MGMLVEMPGSTRQQSIPGEESFKHRLSFLILFNHRVFLCVPLVQNLFRVPAQW